MNMLPKKFILNLAFILFCINSASATEQRSRNSTEPGDIQIELEDGLLSLETRDAPLYEVIHEIGELAGFKTILVEDFSGSPQVNVIFKKIPVHDAVERLVSDKNRIIFYTPANDETGRRIISKVWLLGAGGVTGGTEPGADEILASGKEKVVKEHKLTNLLKMLQENQEVQVRTRAAIALGALQDERAVLALESAVLDTHSTVRFRAINALGQIGGERATMVLGNILLNSSADITERVSAAQALWKLDTKPAQGYLQAGANDTNEQIRLASSEPSSTPK